MIKQQISDSQLQAELNKKLYELLGNDRIKFGGIHRLAELDEDGSNWSKSVTMKGSSEEVSLNSHLISKVLNEVSEKFNLDEK